MSNFGPKLFLYVVRNQMLVSLEISVYRKDPNHSLDEHIHVIYNKLWTFHLIYSELKGTKIVNARSY